MLNFIKGENITSEEQFKNIFETVLRRSETVNQFGQTIPNPNLKNDDPTLINTEVVLLEVFNEIHCDQVINLSAYNWSEYEALFNELENLGFETENHESGNTYNWGSPLTNHLNFRVFKNLENNQAFYMLEVHNGYSDIRGGYPLNFGFLVDLNYTHIEGTFVELFLDNEATNGFFGIGEFNFSFDMFSESGCFNIYNDETGFDDHLYIGDYNDCKEWVLKEEKKEIFTEIFNNKLLDIEVHSFDPDKNILCIKSDDKSKDILEINTPNCRTLSEVQEYLISTYDKEEIETILEY